MSTFTDSNTEASLSPVSEGPTYSHRPSARGDAPSPRPGWSDRHAPTEGGADGMSRNLLLRALAPAERARLAEHLESVILTAGEEVVRPGEPVTSVYFPENAVLAIRLQTSGARRVSDFAAVGCEGGVAFTHALARALPREQIVTRIGGSAYRLGADVFRALAGELPGLREIVDRYLHVQAAGLLRVIYCERFHTLEQRLATHLLLTQDRRGNGFIPLTHAQLGNVLGVRRAGVTQAMARFPRGTLEQGRSRVLIRDRERLEAAACSCYRSIRDLVGSLAPASAGGS